MFKDPRHYQLVFLTSFLVGGIWLKFIDIKLEYIAAYMLSVLLAQYCLDAFKLRTIVINKSFNWKSALISGLSLCLLLRMPSLFAVIGAGFIAILSKGIFKFNNKHIFNPANISIVICVLLFDGWISPGQWGNHALLLFIIAGLGFIVSIRAARADVALVFILSFSGILLLRAWYLGDPLSISLHQLNNGALFLFAFFMITDPRTSPNHKTARLIYAVVLAVISYVLQFHLHISQGMLFALALTCVFVPVLNSLWQARSYKWPSLKNNTSDEHASNRNTDSS